MKQSEGEDAQCKACQGIHHAEDAKQGRQIIMGEPIGNKIDNEEGYGFCKSEEHDMNEFCRPSEGRLCGW